MYIKIYNLPTTNKKKDFYMQHHKLSKEQYLLRSAIEQIYLNFINWIDKIDCLDVSL